MFSPLGFALSGAADITLGHTPNFLSDSDFLYLYAFSKHYLKY